MRSLTTPGPETLPDFAHPEFVRNAPLQIFCVNWFRKDANGKFLWSGYGENMRVLKWMVDRCQANAGAMESPLGWMPRHDDLEWNGLSLAPGRYAQLMELDPQRWLRELAPHQELFAKLDNHLPPEFLRKREPLIDSLRRTPERWTTH